MSKDLRPRRREIPWGFGRVKARPRSDGSVSFQALWTEKQDGGFPVERAKTFDSETKALAHLLTIGHTRAPKLKMPNERILLLPKLAKVYFIQGIDGGPIKIGIADDPIRRLDDLQACSPVLLRLLGTIDGDYETELKLHRAFAPLRHHGEWFRPDEILTRWITNNATTENGALPDFEALSGGTPDLRVLRPEIIAS